MFLLGMTNNVRFTFSVGALLGGLQLVLSHGWLTLKDFCAPRVAKGYLLRG